MKNSFVKYILCQKIKVAVSREEWYDIMYDTRKDFLINFAKELKKKDPTIVLSLREVVETEIDIDD